MVVEDVGVLENEEDVVVEEVVGGVEEVVEVEEVVDEPVEGSNRNVRNGVLVINNEAHVTFASRNIVQVTQIKDDNNISWATPQF